MLIPKWTSRDFDFNYPADHFPYMLERLRGTSARICDMIKDLPADKLTHRPNGAWSIQEHIGHLIDLDELHEGRIDDYLNELPVLRAADMQNKKTYEARHNNNDIEVLVNCFQKARWQFVERLKKLDPQQVSQHPRLQKPMRVVDMAFFVAEHDDHHLSIMRNIVEA